MQNVLFFFANTPVYSYGFMVGLGLVLGSVLAQREGKRKGFGADFIFRFIIQTAAVFVIVGRIGTVWALYGWRTLIYPWTLVTGAQLDEFRGLIGAALYAVYFLATKVDEPASFLDVFAPPVALMQSLSYLGSSVLGRETTIVWGIEYGEFVLHPIPLYAALAYYLQFSILWNFRRTTRYDGQLFLGYLTLSALIQRLVLPFIEVYGESTNPGLYTLATLVFGSAWLYAYMSAPLAANGRRRKLSDWRSWLMYIVSVVGIGLCMIKFFYWRFS